MAIGRLGDLVNGEHLARATSLPWGVIYTHPDSPAFATPERAELAAALRGLIDAAMAVQDLDAETRRVEGLQLRLRMREGIPADSIDLDGLERDPMSLVGQLDWVTKQSLLRAYMERDDLAWNDPKIALLDLQYHDLRSERSLAARVGGDPGEGAAAGGAAGLPAGSLRQQADAAPAHPPPTRRPPARRRRHKRWGALRYQYCVIAVSMFCTTG